jgi:hypothetical protein
LVIVWTATGAPPPMGTLPTWIWRSEAIGNEFRDSALCGLETNCAETSAT